MAVDAQTLLTEAQCYECFASNGYMLNLMKLSLLRQILLAQNPMADTTPQALLAAANCYTCYAGNDYALKLMELALLAQIVGGGSGTGGAGLVGVVDPEGVVVASPGTSYYNTVLFKFWYKLSGVGNTGWFQVV